MDWRTHLDACRKSREAVATKFPDVRSALDRIGREAKDAVDKIETASLRKRTGEFIFIFVRAIS